MHQLEFERVFQPWMERVPYEYRDSIREADIARWNILMIMGRDFFIMALIATITAIVRVIEAWNNLESSKREAEKQRMESELAQKHSNTHLGLFLF